MLRGRAYCIAYTLLLDLDFVGPPLLLLRQICAHLSMAGYKFSEVHGEVSACISLEEIIVCLHISSRGCSFWHIKRLFAED